jgi:hypothetical protein
MGGNLEEQWKNLPLTEGEDEGIDEGIHGRGGQKPVKPDPPNKTSRPVRPSAHP